MCIRFLYIILVFPSFSHTLKSSFRILSKKKIWRRSKNISGRNLCSNHPHALGSHKHLYGGVSTKVSLYFSLYIYIVDEWEMSLLLWTSDSWNLSILKCASPIYKSENVFLIVWMSNMTTWSSPKLHKNSFNFTSEELILPQLL